jgi:hypothetical protein
MVDTLDHSDDEESANGQNLFEQYEDVSWIPATSVECERFFSMVGLVFTQRRKSMEPTTLETILFLKNHRKMLTLVLVNSALKNVLVRYLATLCNNNYRRDDPYL